MAKVETNNSTKINMNNTEDISKVENISKNNGSHCSIKQLLFKFIPIALVGIFAAIFIPIYDNKHDKDDDKHIIIDTNNINNTNNTNNLNNPNNTNNT